MVAHWCAILGDGEPSALDSFILDVGKVCQVRREDKEGIGGHCG